MAANVKSLQAKLLNVSRQRELDFQLLLNRFGAEQFLARLSLSPFADKVVFKGGALLTYLIETDRKTKDLDFLIKEISNQVDELIQILRSVQKVPLDDGITWDKIQGRPLRHPDMEYPGVRIICHFRLGQMKGHIRMDFALGDVVEPIKITLPKVRYKGEPLIGKDFMILAYPLETIFSEKLQIALYKKEGNTRMKDYYDLFKLSHYPINIKKLRQEIYTTFSNRDMKLVQQIQFDQSVTEKLQTYWLHYRSKEKLEDSPEHIEGIIEGINHMLSQVFKNEE